MRQIEINIYRYRSRALLALLAGVVLLLLALTSGPARAATAFTVNKTGDASDRRINGVCDAARSSGKQCTLRAAIQEANATVNSGGPDEINFAIGGTASVKSISPTRPLPAITESVIIDGYTQGSTTATTSDDAKANDNPFHEGSDAIIKVQLNGTKAGASANGLKITAADSTIKGLAINRFKLSGILVKGSLATGNKVEGNFIGTNALGTQALPNVGNGVYISGAPSNIIGGTQPAQSSAQSNVISGNGSDGVEIGGTEATGNRVERNYIGTDASGSQDLGNSLVGVYIRDASDNTIGSNVISGNNSDGVTISGTGATGNRVQVNRIGVSAFSSYQDLGNAGDGVHLTGGAHDNFVGGASTVQYIGNTIAFNGGDGVLVDPGSTAGNRILSNEIRSNSGLGIDLSGGTEDSFGVTANDVDPNGSTDDSDTGPNNLQNFPVITEAIYRDYLGYTTIQGTLDSTPNQTFRIEMFYLSPPDVDPSNHGEGDMLFRVFTVTTNANGHADFNDLVSNDGGTLTATATNLATGDTSEFSENVDILFV